MPTLQEIYDLIERLDDPSVDVAMAAALPTADLQAARWITLATLERRHPRGLLALVECFHLLENDLQQAVVQNTDLLYRALRQAISGRQATAAGNAVRIIRSAGVHRLAYLLVDQLRHGPDSNRRDAAECLLHLAQTVDTRPPRPTQAVENRSEVSAFLQDALDQAVAGFGQHHQTLVLTALATMWPRATPGAVEHLRNSRHPATLALRGLLERADHVAFRRALLPCLAVPTLAESAAAGLLRAGDTATGLSDVLACGHLLAIHSVRQPLRRLTDPGRVVPLEFSFDQLTPEAMRHLPRLIAALPLAPQQKLARLARFKSAPDALSRLSALRQLTSMTDEPDLHDADVNTCVAVFCDDTQPSVARVALRHLSRRRWNGLPALLLRLVNSPDPAVRQIAATHLAPLGFARLWDSWPRLTHDKRLYAGRALMKIDPFFHQQLGERLQRTEADSRLRALSIIHTLNQGALFEPALLVLSRSADKKVAASAVRALGSAASEQAVQGLERALEHADSRVRANAVEALQQLQSTRHVHRLVEMAQADENRPRANAIAALMQMRSSDALSALVRMLSDPRPRQRVSALWLVQHMGLIEVARHVAELAVTDPDSEVKRRAHSTVEQMIQTLDPTAPGARRTA